MVNFPKLIEDGTAALAGVPGRRGRPMWTNIELVGCYQEDTGASYVDVVASKHGKRRAVWRFWVAAGFGSIEMLAEEAIVSCKHGVAGALHYWV